MASIPNPPVQKSPAARVGAAPPPPSEGAAGRLWAVGRRIGVPLLRACLGLVFIWFGALKVSGDTPVADLVAGTVPWLDAAWFVPALGWFEVALGVALLVGYRPRVVALVLAVHLAGTFLTFVMQPAVAFRGGNPLLLTTEGEFVAKNLVLVAAALVVAAQAHRSPPVPH